MYYISKCAELSCAANGTTNKSGNLIKIMFFAKKINAKMKNYVFKCIL